VDALSALIAELLAGLRAVVAPELCPGGWAWATTVLGVGVGLLPAVGATAAVWLRRRAPVGPGLLAAVSGLVTAGLLPLLVIVATGQVFVAAAAGNRVTGLGGGELRGLATAHCFVGSQAAYLGEGTVGAAFDPDRPLLFGTAVFAFGLLPLVAALFVAVQARLALRGAPKWPVKFFWLPVLALPVLTAADPAGASGHLWLGATAGTLAGIPAVLLARPSRSAMCQVPPVRPSSPGPTGGGRPRRTSSGRPGGSVTGAPPSGPLVHVPVGSAPGPVARVPAALAALWARSAPVARTLAARFAPWVPVPSVVAPPVAPVRMPGPTLVLPEEQPEPHARFRVVRRLGAGGFGRVWLAHDAHLGQAVALKAALVPDDETEQRIRREAKALATVRHENCVHIHDLVPARSDPGLAELSGMVIVMEYVDGASLDALVRDHGPLDDLAAARIWAGVAEGLDAAHRRGVLHRDVKPANLVVDGAGVAHLIDFGIARSDGDATLTLAGFILGTPDFLAPEVAAGASATPASDAWQLAATVSFAMTGHPPRGVHTDVQAGLRAAAAGAPLTHLPVHTAHRALLRAGLATDPAARPSLPQVHAALGGWLHHAGSPLTGSTLAR